jgi:hypothetical protein
MVHSILFAREKIFPRRLMLSTGKRARNKRPAFYVYLSQFDPRRLILNNIHNPSAFEFALRELGDGANEIGRECANASLFKRAAE